MDTKSKPNPAGALNGPAVRVGTLAELMRQGVLVVAGPDCPIAVFHHEGRIYAVDNRCPHLGFPLAQGTVEDGILTCTWHHARFDLSSGCTFDLWADDVPKFLVETRDGDVFVLTPPPDPEASRLHWLRRLREGVEHGLSLQVAKAVVHLVEAKTDPVELIKVGADLGTRYRDSWGAGMTILTAMANLVPTLPRGEAMRGLFQGLRRVANDIGGEPTRRERHPLEDSDASNAQLSRWLRHWTLVRHRDGAERCILTAWEEGNDPATVVDLFFTAAMDRPFADVGHLLDFGNKALELLDIVGWDWAPRVLPTLTAQLVLSRGGEETSSWHHPDNLIGMVRAAEEGLAAQLKAGSKRRAAGKAVPGHMDLLPVLLGDDPREILGGLGEAFQNGAAPAEVARWVAYAAGMRIARFGTGNEVSDWIASLHTFSAANALCQVLERLGEDASPGVVRGIFHGAFAVFLDRFLNIPPAPLPGERGPLDDLPDKAPDLLKAILAACDETGQDMAVGRLAARYLSCGHPVGELEGTLALAALREDADFHTLQMLEAGIRQARGWPAGAERDNLLVATARYIAAQAPTQRAQEQTFTIARRLSRGEALHLAD